MDAGLDITANDQGFNSAEETIVGTAVGGSTGKGVGGLVDDISKAGHKGFSNAVNFVTGLFKDTVETVSKKFADENK